SVTGDGGRNVRPAVGVEVTVEVAGGGEARDRDGGGVGVRAGRAGAGDEDAAVRLDDDAAADVAAAHVDHGAARAFRAAGGKVAVEHAAGVETRDGEFALRGTIYRFGAAGGDDGAV